MNKKTALITGASKGIGLAISERLKSAGIYILTPTRQELDLLSNASIDFYLSSLKQPIDILINNAAINLLASGVDVSDENIQNTIQVNLIAPMRLSRGIIPQMIARRYGRIVNISSILGIIARSGRVSYSMSKSGLIGMTKTLAVELAPYNILVNAVAPGYVNTELTQQNNTKEELEVIRKSIPMQRLAEPAEIAEVVAFLVSEKNSYITGQVTVIDGGLTCL